MKKHTKPLAAFLAILILLSSVPMAAGATTVASGSCGYDLTWVLDSEGTLTISGTGPMSDEGISDGEISFERYREYEEQIKSIYISEGVTEICPNAFSGFTSLTSVTIAGKDISIEGDAFIECPNLTSVTLQEGVWKIGNRAFALCPKLTSITLPNSLWSIAIEAFWRTPLTTLHIPRNVSRITGPIVLHTSFNGYTVDESNRYFSADEEGNLLNKDKTKLIHHIFNADITEYTIPENVTTIGFAALAFEPFLEKINIPDTVRTIEAGAFVYCASLKELNLPKSLESMGCFSSFAPSGQVALRKLTIPEDAAFLCNEWYYDEETEEEYLHKNHYEGLSTKVQFITELIVYDRDMDFSDQTFGLYTSKLTEEGIKAYNSVVPAYAEYGAFALLGHGAMPETPDIDTDSITDKNAEPDAVINGVNYYKLPDFTIHCYKGSTAEEYANKYGLNIKYICDEHTEEIIPAVSPTCTEAGLTEGKKCSECGEVLIEQAIAPAKEHNDTDGNYFCDYCGEDLYEDNSNTSNCSHICHKSGIMGFFWEIINFFQMLFGINPVCECGAAHY